MYVCVGVCFPLATKKRSLPIVEFVGGVTGFSPLDEQHSEQPVDWLKAND